MEYRKLGNKFPVYMSAVKMKCADKNQPKANFPGVE
jgi:pyrroloquinoline quinone (PQQ) biosynthesis protein C